MAMRQAPSIRRPRRLPTIIVLSLVFAFIAIRWLSGLWTDFLWYDSVNQTEVWSTRILATVGLAILFSLIGFGFIWLNLVIADRLSPRLSTFDLSAEEELVERFQVWVEPRARRVRFIVAALLAIMIGLGAAAWWQDMLLFFNAQDFGTADPILDTDVGFYVFRLPFYRDLLDWSVLLIVLTTALVATLHYLNGGIRIRQGSAPTVTAGVKVHLSVLLAGLALLKAIGYQLDRFDLLFSETGVVFGAGYTDVNARLAALNLLVLVSILAAVILIANIWRRGWVLPIAAVGGWLFVSIVVAGIIPAVVQRVTVEPDEENKELEYVANNIDFTKAAYSLDNVEIRSFEASDDLSAADIVSNDGTIDNIRLWDQDVLTDTYSELQEIRTYYELEDVDVDRYALDGKLTQVMVASRELDQDELPAQGWVNEHLVYTHGFGAVLSPANDVDARGQPAFLVKDVPPETTNADLEIDQPRIYFGDTYETGSFVIVGTDQKEVDFPTGSGESFAENTYDGIGGVGVGSFARRLAFALRFGDLNTLISNQLNDTSRILMVRNVTDRLTTVAPFLVPDSDPYMALVDGRMQWIVDMYTVSDRFPYSQPASLLRLEQSAPLAQFRGGFNYISNSVKATVDAFDGTVTLFIVDESDPIIRAYRSIFPALFTDGSQISEDLRQHLRYPHDLFNVQSDLYVRFHMEPRPFYRDEDLWEIPPDPSSANPPLVGKLFSQSFDPMLPYYLLMQLPEEDALSYLLLQPFNPLGKPNMTSFMVAKSGPEDYGQIIDYRLPRTKQVDGPGQVGARIDQNPEISQLFTLLDQQGSSVIRGNLLVVPIEESIVYFEPIYVQGETLQLPEFKFVIVLFQDRVVMRETLEEALNDVFGTQLVSTPTGSQPTETPPDSTTTPPDVTVGDDVFEVLTQVDALFEEADAALRAGDLALYQTKIDEARSLLETLLPSDVPSASALSLS